MTYHKKLSISIIIVTFNSESFIDACLKSIVEQNDFNRYSLEIIIVDNYSTDKTINMLKSEYPFVKIISNSENIGYGKANNIGACQANGKYLIIMNPDTIVENGWLAGLLKPLVDGKKLITTPKILVYDGSRINTCGNVIHFTGLACTRGYGSKPDTYNEPEYVCEASGCCFAIKKENFIELGGFDKNIFLYHEDVEFSYRALLFGFKILYVPISIIRHDYSMKINPKKLYYLERGRYLILRKYFSRRDYLLMFPSLLMAEVLTFGQASAFGKEGILYKIKAIEEGLSLSINKLTGDRENLEGYLADSIPLNLVKDSLLKFYIIKFINIIFVLNNRCYKLISKIINRKHDKIVRKQNMIFRI